MTIKKQIVKLAKAIRKEANTSFVDSIILAKWFYHKANDDRAKQVPGFFGFWDYDYAHDIDKSSYTINGIEISSIYRRMKYGR